MGIHNNYAPRQKWGQISLEIAKYFEWLRKEEFGLCIRAIEIRNDETIKIVNRELGGEAELALISLQLYQLIMTLEEYQYIDPTIGTDFADLSHAQICGTKLDIVQPYLLKNIHLATEDYIRLFGFVYSQVINYIVGTEFEDLVILMILLEANSINFMKLTKASIALCFGDNKTYNKLLSQK